MLKQLQWSWWKVNTYGTSLITSRILFFFSILNAQIFADCVMLTHIAKLPTKDQKAAPAGESHWRLVWTSSDWTPYILGQQKWPRSSLEWGKILQKRRIMIIVRHKKVSKIFRQKSVNWVMSAVKAISFVTHVYQMSQMIIISGQYLSNERKKIPYSRSS